MRTVYICSICGWQSERIVEAEKCENDHKKVKDFVIDSLYYEKPNSTFPEKVVIKHKDSIKVYYREDMVELD